MSPRPSNSPDRSATLATVAEAVGVSRMTVSNAYNRPDQLSPALRERILATARELGYPGPNPVAQTLSRGRTGSIGLVLDYPLTEAFTDPATVQFLHGVAAGCEERALGLSLVPQIAGRDAALVRTALVDGFVIYSTPPGDPRVDAVRERNVPYVLVDFAPDAERAGVNVDDEVAARRMAEHLLALGHRSFGLVVSFERPPTARAAESTVEWHVGIARMAGWRSALAQAGIDWGTVPVGSAPGGGRETGRRAAAQLLDRADRPTALLAFYDLLALGALDAAAERGVAVPTELSIAGFDDIPEAALATPPLTTIRQPHARKGAEAVRLLLEGDGAESVVLPTELVVRASTAPAP